MTSPARGNCIGQIAEIYDGAEPQRPQGCTAQAWSVAEILRMYVLTASGT
jgi:glycogen debranching enzyme